MATWTPLKIELMVDGTEDTTWGQVTNENWEALESAVAGSVDVAFSSADVTLSLSNTSAPQDARNLRLVCTGTSGGARNLNVPAIEKLYLITNSVADTVTVKTVAGTGIAVPTGKSAILYCNGTNVVNSINYFESLSLTGTPTAPTASPGTSTTQIATTAFVDAEIAADLTTERTATATLTNKTISVDDNTVSGIAASSFVLSNASGNIDGAAAQKVIPAGVVVGDTDTQTLTNKTLTSPTLTTPAVDVINEATSGAGVTVDGLLIKDGALPSAAVLTATAGASVGGVGTYAFLQQVSGTLTATGNTVAGSNLRYATADGWDGSSATPSGTWRNMGLIVDVTTNTLGTSPRRATTLWLRVS